MVSTVNQVYIYIKNLVSTKYIVYQVKLVYIYVYVYVYVNVYCTFGCRKDILIYMYMCMCIYDGYTYICVYECIVYTLYIYIYAV